MLRPLLMILLASGACEAQRRAQPKYHSLYGPKDENLPIAEALGRAALGISNFLREGDELLRHELEDAPPAYDQQYDFVVVGAGSAGATVASRLSEAEDATVLLIEAGRNENLLMDIPVLVNYLQFSSINWAYRTESSNRYCLGMTDRKCNFPRGKVMGGSSVLNYMIATRGDPRDYDGWAEMGNDGWSYGELLKYFRKLEEIGVDELRADDKLHNTEGPLYIDHPTFHTPLADAFLRAGLQLGYPVIDYNGDEHVGYSFIQATIKNGTRMSSNRAYLHPARHRPNLSLSRMSHANKVLIDPLTKRALGVDFTKYGRNFRVRARKEVILCAGAIGSAQILMLSGVGPSDHLREMGVPLLQNAPVGRNLMDHIAYGGLVFLVDQPVSIRTKDLINPVKPYLSDFFNKHTGPLTVPGGCEALAFVDVDRPNDLTSWPNIELLFIGGSVVSDASFHHNIGISDKYWNKYFARLTGAHSWTIFPMLMRPKSRGKILLRSNNPNVHPRIFANYLDDPEDVRVMIKGIRAAIQVSKTEPMRRFKSKLYDLPVPGCEAHRYDSDEYWECAIRTFPFTIYHHSGTCKMAPDTDPSGVVNPRLQVKGIKGLRVADASIMPMIMTGHPNIPVIMIGEKLADMVKEDWGYNSSSNSL
ncbi:glucose dehydrogenase [FAD, quinone]-like [Phymastichus coffea]|uniref:glucose dehydrogenase [FAD, quinone]-like n=1 Tax=Phymastichus coffea TaxID=108790 RepID=UPI00273AF6CD|nr:glucose dehydrogenase [FAD, quinone]-like [Phymastichus coffea]